jgi:hypothetical protein
MKSSMTFVFGLLLGLLLVVLIKTNENASLLMTETMNSSSTYLRDNASTTIASQQEGDKYTFETRVEVDTCLDPSGPLPVIIMSLGRSGTDSTWQILAELSGTKMQAMEIVGAYQAQTNAFFRALDGQTGSEFLKAVEDWDQGDYDWRVEFGGSESTFGFYRHIKDFCKDGNCRDGKWIFNWFCDEQQRHKATGGLVGFKWKAFMSALETTSASNALKIVAQSSTTATPIRVIRSRRNPLDYYLSLLKHSSITLPDHCDEGDEECFKKHASVRLTVPVEEMYKSVTNTFEEENAIDEMLSELGIMTAHVNYDELYYARTEEEGAKEWNKMFNFLGQRANWKWSDIAKASGLAPTTKSRSHKVLIDNFDEVQKTLKGTKLEQFLRGDDS